MIKSVLASILVLSGCVTSGMKTLETQYVPGDCLKLNDEVIAREFKGHEDDAKMLDLQVLGVLRGGYLLAQYVEPGFPVAAPIAVKNEDVAKDLVEVECPAYLQQQSPAKQPVGEEAKAK